MRLVLSVLLALMLAAPAVAAKRTSMSLAQTQASADKGDADASAALAMTTDKETCTSECNKRGHDKAQCVSACRPGMCHPGAEQPYCVEK